MSFIYCLFIYLAERETVTWQNITSGAVYFSTYTLLSICIKALKYFFWKIRENLFEWVRFIGNYVREPLSKLGRKIIRGPIK